MNAIARASVLEDSPVDSGKLFLPEAFTPLFYTPAYGALTPEQRLRYNQLHALYFNEQILYFETALGHPILEALLRQAWPDRLADGLRQFQEEERQHSAMFRRLNQRCAPDLYAGRDFYFVQVPKIWQAASGWAVAHPLLFPLFLWLMLVQEERSLFYSRGILRHRESVEPHFVKTHRLHLADEVGHVRWDEELLDALWHRSHPVLRKANAKLFAWMLGEFFTAPKRAQLRVVDELVRELPELRERRPELRRQLLALSSDNEYRTSLYSREIVPRTFARLDAAPEFRALEICGYRPRGPQWEVVR
ncbi:MAG TPA: diiron oxygenase [Thermoanaerobaculia bacterium]|jgi:hypothetical protein|nr:diiron oxygenase [Thermoanaerobaculia bacterium]